MKIEKSILRILLPLAAVELAQVGFYKQLSADANRLGFLKAQKYFLKESQEEAEHFDGWLDYITGRGNDFTVPAIPAPSVTTQSLLDCIVAALNKEIEVSKMYNDAAISLMGLDQLVYQKILDYLKIQNEAIQIYTDMAAVFEGLEDDKTGQLVAEQALFS